MQASAPSRGCARTRRARPRSRSRCRASPPLKSVGSTSTPAAGDRRADRTDRRGPDRGAAVGEVVARHAGEDDVAQAHRAHGVGDPRGLVLVDGVGLGGHHVAEPAPAGALRSRGSGRSPRAPPSTRRCSGTSPPRTRCGGSRSRMMPLRARVVRAAPEPHLQPRRLALAARVHARVVGGTVRDAHDRQVQAALRGVVIAVGHASTSLGGEGANGACAGVGIPRGRLSRPQGPPR